MSVRALRAADYIARFDASWLAVHAAMPPWQMTAQALVLVAGRLDALGAEYRVADAVAVHRSATVEAGAVIKGPAILGPGCLVAAGAYLRDGCWLEEACVVGPGAELKSAFLFRGAKLAHFNFVGDSLVGADVNLEAGAIVANHRNERPGSTILLTVDGRRIDTGSTKFGALIGDGTRIGANAVIAPGALLGPSSVVPRLALVDQDAG